MKTLIDEEIVTLKKQLSARFEQLRKDQKLTQVELSELLGTSQNLVYRTETDLKLSLDSFLYVVTYFVKNYNVNPEWLIAQNVRGVPTYTTDLNTRKRVSDSQDKKRSEIVKQMIKLLADENLIDL